VKTARIRALESAVARYRRSLENFAAIHEELRRLPPSERLTEILDLTTATLRSTEQLARTAEERLVRERQLESGAILAETPSGAFASETA
jgi:hypothetical protein